MIILVLALVALGVGSGPGRFDVNQARALSCEVTTLADMGEGSLRAAMEADDCDTITFADGLTGTITLETDLPSIDRALTIVGPGADFITLTRGTIHSSNIGFHAVAGGVGEISGLTIANSRNCAQVNDGSLSFSRMVIHSCYHGIEVFSGSLTVDESRLHSNANSAIAGGGLTTIMNSTMFSNYSNIFMYYNVPLLTLLNNSMSATTSYNVFAGYGPAYVLNNTISGGYVGFGLFAFSSGSIVTNNLFANSASTCNHDTNWTATFTNNIAEGLTDCFAHGVDGNQVIAEGAAGLQPLAFNGGPTETFALSPSSPAVDAGDQATCIAVGAGAVNGVDQRGVSRTTGAGALCDIGAYERSSTCIVGDAGDTATGPTLRAHMLDENCASISFDLDAMGTDQVNVGSQLPEITRDLSIIGPGADELMIRGSIPLMFRVSGPDARLEMSGLSAHDPVVTLLISSTAPGEAVILDDVDFFASSTAIVGNGGDEVVVRNSRLDALLYGATISANKMTIESSTVLSGNTGFLVRNELVLSSSRVSAGSTAVNFDTYDAVVTVVNSTISNSHLAIYGTGGGSLTVLNSTIALNTNAIVNTVGIDLTVKNTLFSNSGFNCSEPAGSETFEHNIGTLGDCFTSGVNGNLVVSVPDLGLDPAGLQDNTGPTETIALLSDSPARDAGNNAVCSAIGDGQVNGVDQRGTARDVGACDIGAFEFTKLPQTIAPFALPNVPHTSGLIPVQGTTSAGLPIEYFGVGSCYVVGGAITLVGAGICEITASQPGNDDYLPATPVVVTFMIFGPGPVTTISLSPPSPNGFNGWYRTPVGVTVSATHPTQIPLISCGTALGTDVYTWGTISSTCFSGTNMGQFFDSGIFTITAGATTTEDVQGDLVSRTVKIDKDAPTVSLTGITNGATYLQGSVPFFDCNTSDLVSGIGQASSLSVTGGNAWGGGSFTATCSTATDIAGNASAPISVNYSVTCQPTITFQGIVMVKVNAAVKVPRVTTATIHVNPATCAVTGVTMAPVGAPAQGSVSLSTANANWKPIAQTGADQWQFGVKTANAATGGVYLNNAYRALNGTTTLTVKLLNNRSVAYIKLAGMAPTGVGTTLAGIEAESSPTLPLVVN